MHFSFVLAMLALNMNAQICRLFHTYHGPRYPALNCTIWEAVHTMSAAPMFFKCIIIDGKPYVESLTTVHNTNVFIKVCHTPPLPTFEYSMPQRWGCPRIIVPHKSYHASCKPYYMSSRITHSNMAHTLILNTHRNDYGTECRAGSCSISPSCRVESHRDTLELLPR